MTKAGASLVIALALLMATVVAGCRGEPSTGAAKTLGMVGNEKPAGLCDPRPVRPTPLLHS